MKKFLVCFTMCISLICDMYCYAAAYPPDAVTAAPTTAAVKVDGIDVSFSAFNIAGYNYFRLRDIAFAVNFNVDFEPHSGEVLIDTGNAYYGEAEQYIGKAKSPEMTVPVKITVHVDNKKHSVTSYNIGGYNYLKLRDIALLADFGVDYDERTKTISISTEHSYTEALQEQQGSGGSGNIAGVTRTGTFATTNTDGSINIPQGDGKFVPNEGDVIRCDDGTNYTIMDMSRYDKSMFAIGPLGPLPDYDTAHFKRAELPRIEVKHNYTEYNGHKMNDMNIFNAYEARRVEYTLYNLIQGNSETWVNGDVARSISGKPLVTVNIGKSEDDIQNFYCWPYNEELIVNYFNKVKLNHYKIEVWDRYGNGVYQFTEYQIYL